MSNALSVEGLSHKFGDFTALNRVGFSIKAGSFVVLLGPNGAGKTTLYSLMTRLYANQSGRIAVFGVDVAKKPTEALAQMGVVFQQPTLDLDLSVSQNLRYHAFLHGLSGKRAAGRIDEELARMGLANCHKKKVRQLSGGQRRRVEIARSLLHKPKLMLLDEPTVGLDIPSRREIRNHVRRLCREEKMAVLWASHLIDEIDESREVIILHKGRVRGAGKVGEVVKKAKKANIHQTFDYLTEGPTYA